MLRIGHGYDIHRFAQGRPMVLCGVRFSTDYGLEGHSDADCATHALCDAILGAAALPDIGHFFPNTDPAYKGIDSQLLLKKVVEETARLGFRLCNVDLSIIAEKPKIQARLPEMKATLAATLGIPIGDIGIKATTNEGLGAIGKGLGIAAHAVVLLEKQ